MKQKRERRIEHEFCYFNSETEPIICTQAYIVAPEVKKAELEKTGSSAGKLFRRLLRASLGFQESVNLQERDIHVGVLRNNYYEDQKEIETALLEAERERAKALMELQRRPIIC